jgi:acetyl-CoA acyltransferase 1
MLSQVEEIISRNVLGVPPHIMGIGPSVAIPALLEKAGLSKDSIGIFEINEAFAS